MIGQSKSYRQAKHLTYAMSQKGPYLIDVIM